MRTFEKSYRLNGVCYDVRGPVVEEAVKMQEKGIKVLHLNIGNPAPFGFSAPPEVLKAMENSLVSAQGYSESKGILSAREAIYRYHKTKQLERFDLNGIFVGNGVSEMISISMQALLNEGDEILIPSPDYPLWTAAAKLSGGIPVHYLCDEASLWYPDLEDMERKITSRTKGIVIINPNNPTGALYPVEILEKIVGLARKYELILFADEIYDRLIFDEKIHTSIASLAPDLFCVTFNGLSKSHLIAGYRCGWMVVSGDLDKAKGYLEGINMLVSMRLCANVPAQYVIEPALQITEESKKLVSPGGRVYEQREKIFEAIQDIDGLSVVKPEGAFYIFPRIDVKKFRITNDEKFVLDFLRRHHVLLVHGRGFNWDTPDHFRIVFLPEVDTLITSMNKMKRFLSTYQQF